MTELETLQGKWEPKRLLPGHRKIIELAIDGLSHRDIARLMGRTPEGIGLVLGSKLVQEEIARRRGEVEAKVDGVRVLHTDLARQTLNEASLGAAERLAEIALSSVDEKTSKDACKQVLDFAFGSQEAGKGGTQVTVLNIEQLAILQQVLREDSDEPAPRAVEAA